MYKEAEQAYVKVLELENTDDQELEEELNKVRALQLQVKYLLYFQTPHVYN